MSEYLIQGETLTNIADAIREKKGTSNVILVSAFADEISTIETGSGGGGGMLTASTEEEMLALITEENIGQFIYYNGVTGTYVNGEYYKVVEDDTPDARYCQLYDLPYSATASDIAVGKQAFNGKGGVITGTGVMSGQVNKMSYIIGAQDSIYSSYSLNPEDFGGIVSIRAGALSSLSGLFGVSLPTTCKTIGTGAFSNCINLKTVNTGGAEQVFASAFGSCFSLSAVDMPNVVEIMTDGFRSCSYLKYVSAPELLSTQNNAFLACNKLSSVYAPKLEYIGANFASWNSTISFVDYPNVSFVGSYAFQSISTLQWVSLPNAEILSDGCFLSCRALSSVYIPKVINIGGNVFQSCIGLKYLVIPSTCISIGSSAFFIATSYTVRIEATTPPTISSNNIFYTAYLSELQVPPNCLETYQTALYWSAYSAKMVEYIE